MKKAIVIFLALQVTGNLLIAQTVDREYDFPVKPGTNAWQAFTTHKQMVEATTLPAKTATGLTTRALLETCLNYPLLPDMMAFNSPQQGLEAVIRNFNGLQELVGRKDVALHIVKAYQRLLSTDISKLNALYDKGKLSFQLSFIELLLGQKKVLSTTDKTMAGTLKTHIATAISFKAAHSDIFSATANSYTLFLAGNLYHYHYRSVFSAAAHEFLQTGLLKDPAILEEIKKTIQ